MMMPRFESASRRGGSTGSRPESASRRDRSTGSRCTAAALALLGGLWVAALPAAPPASAQSASPAENSAFGESNSAPHSAAPDLQSGAIELGLAGGLTNVEKTTVGSVALRLGAFRSLGPGLLGGEAEIGHEHVRNLDRLEGLVAASWSFQAGQSAAFPFLGAVGGFREEWIGSFRVARGVWGGCAGIRTLLHERAGLRFEARLLRLLNDPVENFTESELSVGLSLFFRNAS